MRRTEQQMQRSDMIILFCSILMSSVVSFHGRCDGRTFGEGLTEVAVDSDVS